MLRGGWSKCNTKWLYKNNLGHYDGKKKWLEEMVSTFKCIWSNRKLTMIRSGEEVFSVPSGVQSRVVMVRDTWQESMHPIEVHQDAP